MRTIEDVAAEIYHRGDSLGWKELLQTLKQVKAQGRHDGMTEAANLLRRHPEWWNASIHANAIETQRDNPKKETV